MKSYSDQVRFFLEVGDLNFYTSYLVYKCGKVKKRLSARGGLWLLQMLSESDTGRCAKKDTGSRVDCEISYQLESGTKHFL